MSENKINQEKSSDYSLNKILLTFFSIINIRILLDSFAYSMTDDKVFSWEHYIHALLYFSSIFLSFSLLLYFFTKTDFKKILLFISKVSFVILAVPFVDLIINKAKINSPYITIIDNNFLTTFFQTANPFANIGITKGIYFSAYITLILFFLFVFKKTKSYLEGLAVTFLGYVIFFIYSIIPNFLILGYNIHSKDDASSAYFQTLKTSWMAKYFSESSILNFSNNYLNVNSAYELVMARIFWIAIIAQIITIFYLSNKKTWQTLAKNLRIERVFNYSLISVIGIILSHRISTEINISNPLNFIALFCFLVLLALHAWLAVFINDDEDIRIDEISNSNRPLAKKEICIENWISLRNYLFIIIIFGTLILNTQTAFLLALAQCAFYIYSSQPARLKKHFIFSSIVIGFTTIVVAMAGFYLVSPDQSIQAFPLKAILIIGFSYALLSNVKDIKDYAGDKAENIRTIPVVFGLGRSKKIIAALYAIIFMSTPYFLEIPSLMPFAISASIFSYYLFTKKDFNEKYIFFTKFAYMLVLFLMTM
ncbi:MAG TPA: UbiA family prenyltransferase [Patescibacteria group bacterium]